jgi:hypothetical protein
MLPFTRLLVLLQMLPSIQMLPDGTLILLPMQMNLPLYQEKRSQLLLMVQLPQLLPQLLMMMTMMTMIFSVPTVKLMKKLKSSRLNVLKNTERRRLPNHKKLLSL